MNWEIFTARRESEREGRGLVQEMQKIIKESFLHWICTTKLNQYMQYFRNVVDEKMSNPLDIVAHAINARKLSFI